LSVTALTRPSPKSTWRMRSPTTSLRSPLSRTVDVTLFAHSVFGLSAFFAARASAVALGPRSLNPYPEPPLEKDGLDPDPGESRRAFSARGWVPPRLLAMPGDCRKSI